MAGRTRVAWSQRRVQVVELMKRHELEKVPFKQLALDAGIPSPTLYSWIARFRRERLESTAADAGPGFVEIEGAGKSEESIGGIELVLASGVRVRVAASFHEPTLKRLLLLLGA